MILEAVVTTLDVEGRLNVAPMGPEVEPVGSLDRFILKPFHTSSTYRNLKAHGEGVLHVTDDVLLLARALLGKVDAPTREADSVRGRILTSVCRYAEFRVTRLDDREPRTTIWCEAVAQASLRDFFGLNRAKHAVVEAAILASRTHLIPIESILHDLDRLQILINKTGGPDEHEAFSLLRAHVEATSQAPGTVGP